MPLHSPVAVLLVFRIYSHGDRTLLTLGSFASSSLLSNGRALSDMAGFEAVGVVLGVLPLIVSAVEHYDDALKPIVRYRHFSSKSKQFHRELDTERTIFRTECVYCWRRESVGTLRFRCWMTASTRYGMTKSWINDLLNNLDSWVRLVK